MGSRRRRPIALPVHDDAMTFSLRAAGLTDVGRKRRHNEDSFVIDMGEGLFVVADGMGGHAAGEVAAKIAVDTIEEFITDTSQKMESTWPYRYNHQWKFNSNRLAVAVEKANERVMSAVAGQPALKGMGTTVVAGVLNGSGLSVAHVGDSRAYRLRGGELRRLTDDHSWVHEQIVTGILTEEEAKSHPLKNVVTRALGGGPSVVPEMQEYELQPGDRYLLCSDGLTTMLSDEEVVDVLRSARDPEAVCRQLVDMANEKGGLDNITVIVIDVLNGEAPA
jgi:serine/threonine protein phosphatase PrpC